MKEMHEQKEKQDLKDAELERYRKKIIHQNLKRLGIKNNSSNHKLFQTHWVSHLHETATRNYRHFKQIAQTECKETIDEFKETIHGPL